MFQSYDFPIFRSFNMPMIFDVSIVKAWTAANDVVRCVQICLFSCVMSMFPCSNIPIILYLPMLQYSRLFSMFRCFNIPIFFECFRRQGLDRGGRRFFSICATSRFAMFPFSVSMFPCFNITINHMVRCFNTPIIIVVRLSDKLRGSMFRHYGSLFQYSDTVMI